MEEENSKTLRTLKKPMRLKVEGEIYEKVLLLKVRKRKKKTLRTFKKVLWLKVKSMRWFHKVLWLQVKK